MPEDLEEEKYPLPDLPHGYRWVLTKNGESIRVSLQRKHVFRWKEFVYSFVYTWDDEREFIRKVTILMREAQDKEDPVDTKFPLGITYGKKEE